MTLLAILPSGRRPRPALETASPALLRQRALAVVFDLVFCYVVIETVLLAAVIGVAPAGLIPQTGIAIVASVVALVPLYLTYAFVFEWRYGQTPGKVWQELVVTTTDGTPPGVVASATRNLLRYIDWLPAGFLLGWLLARRSSRGQRLGDRLAATVVVRPGGPAGLGGVSADRSERPTE